MKYPALLVVSGDDGFHRNKYLSSLRETAHSNGLSVSDFSDFASLRSAMSGSGFFRPQSLLVLSSTKDLDVEFLSKHYQHLPVKNTVVIDCQGPVRKNSNIKSLLKKLNKKHHKKFILPPIYKMDGFCSDFARTTLRSMGVSISDALLTKLISVVGYDLGVIQFECLKLQHLLEYEGQSEVLPRHLKGSIAQITQANLSPLVDAIAAKNPRGFVFSLTLIQRTYGEDCLMLLCNFLLPNFEKWLVVASGLQSGMSLKEIAEMSNLHHFYVKTKIMRPAKKWGISGVVQLITALSEVEKSVLLGSTDPWSKFVSNFLLLLGEGVLNTSLIETEILEPLL